MLACFCDCLPSLLQVRICVRSLVLENCLRPELGVIGSNFGFSSPSDVIIVHSGGLTCCLFCMRLGNNQGDGDDVGDDGNSHYYGDNH